MAMKEQPKQIYRTLNGKEIDMNRLVLANEMTVAVGNVKVNARGDELGPGGQIIRKREDILRPAVAPAPQAATVVRKDVSNMDPAGDE